MNELFENLAAALRNLFDRVNAALGAGNEGAKNLRDTQTMDAMGIKHPFISRKLPLP